MKILIVSGCYYPELTPRAFRTTELAKAFVRLGNDVTVIIPDDYSQLDRTIEGYPVKFKWYHRNADNLMKGGDIVSRIINRGLYQFLNFPNCRMYPAVKKVLKDESGYDLLLSIAVPHEIHWAVGKLYAQGHRIAKTWIADCGDPWMLCQSMNFKHPSYFKHYETRWCQLCNYITVPTDESYKGYYPEFRDKIKVIPQAFDFSEVKTEEYVPNEVPTFAFSGSFIPGRRDPRPFIDYLNSKGIDYRFVIYTKQSEYFTQYQSRLGKQIIIKDYIPRLDLLRELSKMDFLVNLENGVAAQTPSKLIDYALTGRPILSVNSNNLDTAKIDAFLTGDYTQQRAVDVSRYDIKVVAKQFLELTKS